MVCVYSLARFHRFVFPRFLLFGVGAGFISIPSSTSLSQPKKTWSLPRFPSTVRARQRIIFSEEWSARHSKFSHAVGGGSPLAVEFFVKEQCRHVHFRPRVYRYSSTCAASTIASDVSPRLAHHLQKPPSVAKWARLTLGVFLRSVRSQRSYFSKTAMTSASREEMETSGLILLLHSSKVSSFEGSNRSSPRW